MVGQRYVPAALPPKKWPVTHYIEGWVGPGTVWTNAEYVAPTGMRFPDCPLRNE
jgi:hypothetical protein